MRTEFFLVSVGTLYSVVSTVSLRRDPNGVLLLLIAAAGGPDHNERPPPDGGGARSGSGHGRLLGLQFSSIKKLLQLLGGAIPILFICRAEAGS